MLPECSRNEKYNNPVCQSCKRIHSTKFAHAPRLLNFTSLELHGGILTSSFSSRKCALCYKRAPVEFGYRFYQQIVSDLCVFCAKQRRCIRRESARIPHDSQGPWSLQKVCRGSGSWLMMQCVVPPSNSLKGGRNTLQVACRTHQHRSIR